MKSFFVVLSAACLLAGSVFAASDVQDLKILKDNRGDRLAVTWKYSDQAQVFIDGLTPDLFQRYEIKNSKGPDWKDAAVAVIEKEFDLNESASYWYESTEISDLEACGWTFTEEEKEEVYQEAMAEIVIKNWQAVKFKTGNQNTLIYIVDYVMAVEWKGQTCDRTSMQLAFLNSAKSRTAPEYLGILQSELPKE